MRPRPAAEGRPITWATFLGVRLDLIQLPQLLEVVLIAVRNRDRLTVLYVNAHCMNVTVRDAHYRSVLNRADVVYCDGTGVKLGARLLGIDVPERMTGADWIHDLARLAVRERLTLFLLGGVPGSADRAADALRSMYPGISIVGTLPGYGLMPQDIEA